MCPFALPFVAMIILLLATARTKLFASSAIDATTAGVVGDGSTLNTTAIQQTIDHCAGAGGGTILFPAGKYLTGTIQIKSNVTLWFSEGAILLGSTNVADYRNLDPFLDGSGNLMGHALIVAVDADHVAVGGAGTIDGQGAQVAAKQKPYTMRPFLLRWVRCTNVAVRDIHLINPGAWTLNFFESKNVVVEDITIRSRDQKLRNNDGINIDCSQNIRVRHCDIISGDDALVIKATARDHPCQDISATDCKLSTRTNAIKLGTESIGDFSAIFVTNCQITNTAMCGVALYNVDGGDMHDISITHITMDNVVVPISLRLGSRLKTFREGDHPQTAAGTLHDVTIADVTAKNIGLIGMLINGIPDHPIESLTLRNIQLQLPGGGTTSAAAVNLSEKESTYPEFDMFGKTMPASAIYARRVRNLKLQNVSFNFDTPDARPPTVFIDVDHLSFTNPAASTHPK